MTGAQMITALGAANQAVSGMTMAEAAAAMGGTAEALGGGTSIYTFPIQYQQYGQVTIEAQYAAQLWEYWKTVAGAGGTTVLGAAAGAAVNYARAALIGEGAGTLAATAGILTLSVPTAVALATPLLGVGCGAALYESNPELWTKISNSVVGFLNEGSQTISALITEAGQILIPKGLVDSIKQLFMDENIPVAGESSGGSASGGQLPAGGSVQLGDQTGAVQFVRDTGYSGLVGASGITAVIGAYHTTSNPNEHIFIAASPARSMSFMQYYYRTDQQKIVGYQRDYQGVAYTYQGKTVYYNGAGSLVNGNICNGGAILSGITSSSIGAASIDQAKVAWAMIYGEVTPAGEYQEGTSKWEGAEVDPEAIGTWPAYDPKFGTTEPYVPVNPKTLGSTPGTNVTNPDPDLDPTAPLAPAEVPWIDPYIPPVVSPEIQWPDVNPQEVPVPDPGALVNPIAATDPVYVPEPVLDPATDPATVPEPLPEPATSDPKTGGTPPPSIGFSPPILFPVPDVPFPTISPNASDTPVPSGDPGFVQVYHPSPSELISFGRWLWVTYADATIDKIWNNPFDGVIGCHELYATPTDGGYTTIRCGFLDSGISSQLVRIRYSTINCGSMVIPEYWSNYLDYSPYSKAYIYLPFIGIQELDVDDIVGASVNVCYHIDAYNGSCIAQITCAKDGYTNTLYQFSGNCAVEYPLSGGSQAAIKAAMMTGDAYQAAANTSANATMWGGIGSGLASAVGGIAGGVATGLTGNVAGGISHGISGIASGIGQAIGGYASSVGQRAYGQAQHTASMLSGKSIVQHSGNFGASYGAMGIKKPYIFIRRPIQKVVNNYNVLYGYPAHKQVIIGNCEGFLRCREVHVVSPLATDGEKAVIEQLLTTGVYVTDDFS